MLDESIDRIEHSSFRPRRLYRHDMAGCCDEGWSCTFARGDRELFVEQKLWTPVQQITVGHTKKTRKQLVDGPLPQILGKWWQGCRSYHSGVHANRPVLFDEILKVTQFIPHERIAVVPVPQIMNKLWESQSTFHKGGFSASQLVPQIMENTKR